MPPENLKALAKVAAHTPLPIATGERIHDRIEFRELFECQAADIIQPDIGHIGGILETRKLAATAETHYVLVAPHNVGGPVLTAASLHLAACTPNFKIQEHFNDFADEEVQAGGARAARRSSTATSTCRPRPGSGVELDVDFVAERPQHRARTSTSSPQDWQFRGTQVSSGPHRGAGRASRWSTSRSARPGRARRSCGSPTRASAAPTASCSRAGGPRRSCATRSCPGTSGRASSRRSAPASTRGSSGARSSARASATARPATRAAQGQTTLCEAPYEETGFTQPGAWNDFLRLPARLLHVLPEDADLRAAALLEPAACVAEACLLAALVPGERAAVVGGGTLGTARPRSSCARPRRASSSSSPGARARGAGAADGRRPARLPRRGQPGFDVVIEAAGTPGSAQLAVDLARRGGRVVLTGIPGDLADGVSAQTLVTQAVSVFNVFGAPSRAWVHTVRAFAAGLLDPTPLITHELPLDRDPQAFRADGSGGPEVGKVLLRP